MDQSLKSPGQRALDDAFHAMFELTRTRPAPALAERLDRLARLRAVVSDNEARFEAAISADFGHRSRTETSDRRDHAGARRDQARRQASEEMDGAAARCDRAAIHARQKPAAAAAARRRRHHRAVELSAATDAGAGGGRARRGQPRDDQAERTGAAVFRAAARGDRGQIRRHRDDRDRRSTTTSRRPSHRCRSII